MIKRACKREKRETAGQTVNQFPSYDKEGLQKRKREKRETAGQTVNQFSNYDKEGL